MPEQSPLQKLAELLEQPIDRDNFDTLRHYIYHSYKSVDYADRRVRELTGKLEGTSEAERRMMDGWAN